MKDEDPSGVYKHYFAVFAETVPSKREELVRSVVAEDIMYSNPGVCGKGIDSLLSHISRFQERFPGGSFRINWVRHQHDQLLGEWTQLTKEGAEIVTAHSYAQLDQSGRINRFAGFWEAF